MTEQLSLHFLVFRELSAPLSSGYSPQSPSPLSGPARPPSPPFSHQSSSSGSFLQAKSPTTSLPQADASLHDGDAPGSRESR